MNNILVTIKENIKQIYKQNICHSLLLLLPAMVLISLTTFALSISFSLNNVFLSVIVNILFLVVLMLIISYVICPFIYAVSCQIENSIRYNDKKVTIKEAFSEYYNFNKDAFKIFNVLLKTIGVYILAVIVLSIVFVILASICSKDMFKAIIDFVNSGNRDDNSISNFVNQFYDTYGKQFIAYYIIYNSSIYLISIGYFLSRLRRNESVFYLSNILFTDNMINTKSGDFVLLFNKFVLPSVKKEHSKLDFKVNYLGYIVFSVVFIGITVGLLFVDGIYYPIIPFISLLASLLCYSPFYIKERIFDNLFYLAYEDVILQRVAISIKVLIEQTKLAYQTSYNLNKDEDVVDQTSQTRNEDAKKGEVNQDGVIDFTNNDNDSKDN